MKYFLLIVSFLSLAINGLSQIPQSGIDPADRLVQHLVNRQWKAALRQCSREVKQSMTPVKLQKTWQYLETEYGNFEHVSLVDTLHKEGYYVANFFLLFERVSLNLMVQVNDRDEVVSFVLIPLNYQLPDRMAGKFFNTKRIVVRTDTFEMGGEIMLPDSCNHCPVVILVHGSGPNDRDMTFGPNKIFMDLAVLLAEQGIATLRYDKRTYTYPDLIKEQKDSLTIYEITLDDVLSAVQAVRDYHLTDSSPVFILGHSLGALMAPKIAGADSGIAGAILVAGPTVPLHHLVKIQLEFLFNKEDGINRKERQYLKGVSEAIDDLDSGYFFAESTKFLGPWGGNFWKDLLEYDPITATIDHGKPSLVLFGERDYQVAPALNSRAWEALADTSEKVLVKIYPGLNHLFIYGEGEPNRGEYLNPGHFSEEVVNDIVEWILINKQ